MSATTDSSRLPGPLRRLRARGACGVCITSTIAFAAFVLAVLRPTGITLALLAAGVVAQLVACGRLEEQYVLQRGAGGDSLAHRSWTRTTTVQLDGHAAPEDTELPNLGVVVTDRAGATVIVPAWRLAEGDALAQRIAALPAA